MTLFRNIAFIYSFLFGSLSFAGDLMTKIDWIGDMYQGTIIENVVHGEKSALIDLYENLKVSESQTPFEDGVGYSKKFSNISNEFELKCSILDFFKTTKIKSVSCNFTVKRLQVSSYDVFFYEYSPRMLTVSFKDKYAKEVFDVLDNNGSYHIAVSDKFEVTGGAGTFVFAISE